ncbi:hypothetical protein MRB53_041435 [Persea americana]|nr:hypothetical protein MRB53_041435 [Persea americana]
MAETGNEDGLQWLLSQHNLEIRKSTILRAQRAKHEFVAVSVRRTVPRLLDEELLNAILRQEWLPCFDLLQDVQDLSFKPIISQDWVIAGLLDEDLRIKQEWRDSTNTRIRTVAPYFSFLRNLLSLRDRWKLEIAWTADIFIALAHIGWAAEIELALEADLPCAGLTLVDMHRLGATAAAVDAAAQAGQVQASQSGRLGAAKLLTQLIKQGMPFDLPDLDHRTPLHRASCPGNQPRDWRFVDGLRFAFIPEQAEIIKVLAGAGANLERRDRNRGWTPLMWATWAYQFVAVDALLEVGADVHATSDKGETAASLAEEMGHDDLAEQLRGLMGQSS